MPFSKEELSSIVEEIKGEPDYFSKTESISKRCFFTHIEDKNYDEVAVDKVSERQLEFSIFGRVVRKTTFLQPEGVFHPSGSSTPKDDELAAFLNTSLRASLAPPRGVLDAETAQTEWLRYRSTLSEIIKSVAGSSEDILFWSPYRKDANVFSMRHVLVSERETPLHRERETPRQDQGSTIRSSSPSGELDGDLIDDPDRVGLSDHIVNVEHHVESLTRIKNWPGNDKWHKIADRFAETHLINPLAAFDDEYELIAPQDYEAKLLGAVVHARFTLSRFLIRGTHVFVCNIVELQVLKPPLRGADCLKKRKLTDLVMLKKRKKRRIV